MKSSSSIFFIPLLVSQGFARPLESESADLCRRQATTNPNATAVYAHFIVGIVARYQQSDWKNDITLAMQTGIDGFALNIGTDSYTDQQLTNAYTVAAQMGFKLFISFDFNASPTFGTNWNTTIVPILKKYSPMTASARYNNRALVSTFGGDSFSYWGAIRAQVPSFELIPFVQATNVAHVGADGAFQWNSWPSSNNQPINSTMTTGGDAYYQSTLKGKPYMAGVSPWFFTHYGPQSFNKNYLYLSDTLLIDRWREMLTTVKPQLIELQTWNDFGESHYIGPLHPSNTAVYAGNAGQWVTNMPHDGWRRIIQAYIASYKTGVAPGPGTGAESVVMWYRPNPKALACKDSVGPPTGYQYPADAVFAAAMLKTPATLQICSAGRCNSTTLPAGINYHSVGPFGAGAPTFTLTRNTTKVLSGTAGLAINTASCSTYNFNAYVQAWP